MIDKPAILVPKDVESINALWEQRVEEADCFIATINRDDLGKLFISGLIDKLNERLGGDTIIIDEYEEEDLTDMGKIDILIDELIKFKKENTNPIININVEKIISMAEKAKQMKTGIFFYF